MKSSEVVVNSSVVDTYIDPKTAFIVSSVSGLTGEDMTPSGMRVNSITYFRPLEVHLYLSGTTAPVSLTNLASVIGQGMSTGTHMVEPHTRDWEGHICRKESKASEEEGGRGTHENESRTYTQWEGTSYQTTNQ